jgi:hypothetical protein
MAAEGSTVHELSANECWAHLRTASIGRLAVLVDDHPDIFPINFAVDRGTVVFRSDAGTKLVAALADSPVAFESDGYDDATDDAWSVVVKGRAEAISSARELLDTTDLPLFPWQEGAKGRFVRLVPTTTTGRRFRVADPRVWLTPLSGVRRASPE